MKVRFGPWYSWSLTFAGGFILLTALLVGQPSVPLYVLGPLFLLMGILSLRNPYLEIEDGKLNVRDSFMGKRTFALSDLDFDRERGAFYLNSGGKRKKVALKMNANRKEWDAFVQYYASQSGGGKE